MKLADMKLGVRMGLGFTLVIAILAGAILYALVSLGRLGVLQDEGGKRVKDLRAVEELNQAVGEMYGMVAEIIINKNYDEIQQEWREDSAAMDKRMSLMTEVVDTDAEKAALTRVEKRLTEYRANLEALFALLRGGVAPDDPRVVAKDETIDKNREEVLNELEAITISLASEVDAADADFDQIRSSVSTYSEALLLIAIVFGVAVTLVVTRSIVVPVRKGVAFAEALAKGDLTARIDVVQKDEVGQLAQALRAMAEQLVQVVSDVQAAAENVASGSQELASSSQQMSQGATEQAASIEEVSSSMEEMASNIQQNTDNARQTEQLAIRSAKDAREGGQAVEETVRAMKEIAEKISIIEEIARQTNLLALNAAIEAARAGEAGKGFAVVASEVRKLAERSQAAANQISSLSTVSVDIAITAGEMLRKMVPDIQKTADLVQEVSAGSMEQSAGAGQVNKALQQLDAVVQQNASASEEMASTAEELSGQASQLQESISFFRIDDGGRSHRKAAAARQQTRAAHPKGAGAAKPKALPTSAKAAPIKGIALDLGSDDDKDFESF